MVDSAGNGGFMDNCFAITVKNVVCSEARYSYTTNKGTCKTSDGTVGIAQESVTGSKNVSTDNEQALLSTGA